MRRRFAITLAAVLTTLVATACGGSSSDTSTPKLRPADPTSTSSNPPAADPTGAGTRPGDGAGSTTTPAPATSPLPSVAVLDVATGDTIDFADFLPSDKPVLFWFWAPH